MIINIIPILLNGFGVYTILMLLFKPLFSKNIKNNIEDFDPAACTLAAALGLFGLVISSSSFLFYLGGFDGIFGNVNGLNTFLNFVRLQLFVLTIFYLVIQFMWLKKLQNKFWIRMVIALGLLISPETIVMYLSQNRDYLPSTWSIPFYQQLGQWFWCLVLFLLTAYPFHWIRRRIILKKTIYVHESN